MTSIDSNAVSRFTDRVLHQQHLTSSLTLKGDPAPTPNQVAAVLRSLADHTHLMFMVGAEVRAAGADRADLGPEWEQATGIGRYLQQLANQMETYPDDTPAEKASRHRA